jgi:hypothetical protein
MRIIIMIIILHQVHLSHIVLALVVLAVLIAVPLLLPFVESDLDHLVVILAALQFALPFAPLLLLVVVTYILLYLVYKVLVGSRFLELRITLQISL